MTRLIVPRSLWTRTLAMLERYSAGERESAAVLLGSRSSSGLQHACEVVGYHDLGPTEATAVSLHLSEAGKHQLYRITEQRGLSLLAALHTHPSTWVGLSAVDRANRLSSRRGFWSIVVPNFAQPPWDLDAMGFHIRDDSDWLHVPPANISQHIQFEG